MKLGIIAEDFKLETFEKYKDMGLYNVEFCENTDCYIEFINSTDLINENLSKTGLYISSVGRWGNEKFLSDGSFNEEEFEINCKLIEATAKVGGKIYVSGCNYVDSVSLFQNYQNAITYFSKLIEYGKKFDVKIAVYNCHWGNFVNNSAVWSVVLGHLPDLYIKFDPSHSIYAKGENYLTEMKNWGHRFLHVHIKGSLLIDGERFDDPPAGLDMTNWSAFMGVLYAVGYTGALSLEPHSRTWQGELGEKGVKHSINYMKQLII